MEWPSGNISEGLSICRLWSFLKGVFHNVECRSCHRSLFLWRRLICGVLDTRWVSSWYEGELKFLRGPHTFWPLTELTGFQLVPGSGLQWQSNALLPVTSFKLRFPSQCDSCFEFTWNFPFLAKFRNFCATSGSGDCHIFFAIRKKAKTQPSRYGPRIAKTVFPTFPPQPHNPATPISSHKNF